MHAYSSPLFYCAIALGSTAQRQTGAFDLAHSFTPNRTRMPAWIRQPLGEGADYGRTRQAIQRNHLHTVCEEARCPNRGECWSRGTATLMLLGDTCTRACGFCAVRTGRPDALDTTEPAKVAQAVQAMDLNYVVLTSVNRDDLADGGAGIFAGCYRELRKQDPQVGIEFLTPDFQQDPLLALSLIARAIQQAPRADGRTQLVWGHNVETVPRLYRSARKGSKYQRSLNLLQLAGALKGVETKSAVMLGLGETHDEVVEVLRDLRRAGVDRVSLGQYLRPSMNHLPVETYIHPEEFRALEAEARAMGFGWVKAGPFVRSSYHADDVQDSEVI